MIEKFNFEGKVFQIQKHEEQLKKKWGDRYFGNPADKMSLDFVSEFEKEYSITENINGIPLVFHSFSSLEGGGYGVTVAAEEFNENEEDNIWATHEAEYAYPFFEAVKGIARIEKEPGKVVALVKLLADAVPNGIKKKSLSPDEIKEIVNFKNKWNTDISI